MPWLADQEDRECRTAMLDWLAKVGEDPFAVATIQKARPGIPGLVAEVPGTNAYVDYTVIEMFHTVMILKVVDVEGGDIREY